MLEHILKVTFSNIRENKFNFLIIFLSLILASLTVLFILNYVVSESRHDSFPDSHHIGRVTTQRFENKELIYHSAKSFPGMLSLIEQEIPDIKKTTRLLYEKVLMRQEDRVFNNQHIFWGDAAFFEIFGIKLHEGSDPESLNTKGTCFISETAAKRFFNNENPVNKTIYLNEAIPFIVTGVFKDIPDNAHFRCDFVVSYITLRDHADELIMSSLDALLVYIYYKKDPKALTQSITRKLEILKHNHFNLPNDAEVKLEAQPLNDIHLHSHLKDELKTNSYFKYIVILLVISVFLIICGWINYFNLLSLNLIDRVHDINIKITLGASKRVILFQFIVESVIVNTFCILFSFILYLLFFNRFKEFLQIPGLELSVINSLVALSVMLLLGFILGIILPFILLSVRMFKEAIFNNTNKTRLQAALITIQFTLLGFLLIFSIFLNKQVSYMIHSELNFSMENVLITDTPCGMIGKQTKNSVFNTFRNELIKNSEIIDVTTCSHVPGTQIDRYINRLKRRDATGEEYTCSLMRTDENYFNIFNFNILAGRNFNTSDRNSRGLVLINESALKLLKYSSPADAVNTVATGYYYDNLREYRIIGVVKNYHQESLKKAIEPIIYTLDDSYEFGYYAIRYNKNAQTAGKLVKNTWNQFYPKDPISITPLKTMFNSQYSNEIQLKKLVSLFILVISIISFAGLFTISLFIIKRESKDIGIRKVLGALNIEIIITYLFKFLKLIVPSMIISSVLGYYALDRFSQLYPYHIGINFFNHLLFPIIIILLSSTLIIISSSGVIANINPAKTTKTE